MATQRQPAFDASPIAVRRAIPDDAAACGRICYEAFRKISTEHAFPPDYPSVDVPTGVLSMMSAIPVSIVWSPSRAARSSAATVSMNAPRSRVWVPLRSTPLYKIRASDAHSWKRS